MPVYTVSSCNCCRGCRETGCEPGRPLFDPLHWIEPFGIAWPLNLFLKINFGADNPPTLPQCTFGITDGEIISLRDYDGAGFWASSGYKEGFGYGDGACDPDVCGSCGPVYFWISCGIQTDLENPQSPLYQFQGGYRSARGASPPPIDHPNDSHIMTLSVMPDGSCWPLLATGTMPLIIDPGPVFFSNNLYHTVWTLYQ